MAWDGQNRREDDTRTLEIARAAGYAAANKVLGSFTSHDLTTKDGREALRSDFYYNHNSRIGSEIMKKNIKSVAVKSAVGAATLGFCAAVWQAMKDNLP